MGDGDPPQDLRECAILAGPEQEVPVIRHQAVGGDANVGLSVGFGENLFERGVVRGFVK